LLSAGVLKNSDIYGLSELLHVGSIKSPTGTLTGMPTKSTSMAPDDDDVSISSDSSSSEGSQASVEESLKDPAEDRCDGCWRQSAFCGIIILAATVIFATSILMLNQDTDEFETSVSALSGCYT
jgi:hypothetical protein